MNRTSGFCLYKYVFLCDFPVKIIYVRNTFLTFNANCFIFKDRLVPPSISIVQEHIFSISYNWDLHIEMSYKLFWHLLSFWIFRKFSKVVGQGICFYVADKGFEAQRDWLANSCSFSTEYRLKGRVFFSVPS